MLLVLNTVSLEQTFRLISTTVSYIMLLNRPQRLCELNSLLAAGPKWKGSCVKTIPRQNQ
jgi:hypothetical protein